MENCIGTHFTRTAVNHRVCGSATQALGSETSLGFVSAWTQSCCTILGNPLYSPTLQFLHQYIRERDIFWCDDNLPSINTLGIEQFLNISPEKIPVLLERSEEDISDLSCVGTCVDLFLSSCKDRFVLRMALSNTIFLGNYWVKPWCL